jgi:putative endonuclease
MFNKRENRKIGNFGEDLAAKYLEDRGYKIIGRNVNFPFGEIDIIANFKGIIVIVEVKTVRGSGFGLAQDLVRFAKQNKLRLLARAVEQQYPGKTVRIDVVGVDMSFDESKIEHIESAVEG